MSTSNMETATQELATAKSDLLPEPVQRRGISEAQWRTLTRNLFPGADPQSVLMVIDYCLARKLDPLKRPCHIVPVRVKDSRTGEWAWRDVVMPGIYELRTTAMRTGAYLGHSRPEYGPTLEHLGVKAPEWCEMTFYRHSGRGVDRIEFPVRRYFAEVVGLTKDGKVNDRWSRAPIQMLEKCTEAAGLREAFPDEFGGEQTAEEMDDQRGADPETLRPSGPLPAQRRSQQAAPPAPAEPKVAELVPAPPAAQSEPASPGSVGAVVDVRERQHGTLVKLSTGLQASTRDEAIIRGAKMAREAGVEVELVTKPASDPKYAPVILSLRMVEAAS